MKIVRMPHVRQTWKDLGSRFYRIFYRLDKTQGGRTMQLDVVRTRGLIYPLGREVDPDECQDSVEALGEFRDSEIRQMEGD